ncbi:MAG: hypothetical protein PHQ36_10415, partial [Anaerolineales bacterium]|nr:hypothetical protein [Anaerolineales bacterium]
MTRNLHFNVRAAGILLILYAFGLMETVSFGYSAESFLFFVTLIVSAVLLAGRKGGIIALFASLATLVVVGWKMGQGNFIPLAIGSDANLLSPFSAHMI